ncbi:MAG: ABC transporter substrate-binding protein [Acidimicrobiales bacterium]|nr:ABC transporter substrate-binding protein [Acidimicrobiales bacterium]
MRSRSRRFAAVLAAGSLLALSACSDSVSDDGPAASSDSSDDGVATTRGITDDSIKVGGSIYSVYYGGADVGVQARIKQVNDEGGVHGRMIEYVGAEDTNNESSKDLDNITRLVEQEEVFAILPGLTGVPGGGDYIVENNVPMFGWGTSPAYCNNEVAFGITGCVSNPSLDKGSNALGVLLEEHFDGDTDKSIAFIGEDNDSGRGGIALLQASAAAEGYDVVYAETPLPAPPEVLGDESPFVTELLGADGGEAPDAIYLVATLSGTKLAAALQDAGYEGMIITPSYSPLLLGQAGYDGVFINTQFSMDPEVEANAAMLEAVAAVDPDQQFDLAVAAGYWAADLFIQALEATGPDLTVESLLETLNSGEVTYSVPDVIGEGTWPEGHELSTPCAALTEVQGEEFVPVIPLTCGENITIE